VILALIIVPLSLSFEATAPRWIWDAFYAPATALGWIWEEFGLPPHGEAALAMGLVFAIVQWFCIGAFIGLWLWNRRFKHRQSGKQKTEGSGWDGSKENANIKD